MWIRHAPKGYTPPIFRILPAESRAKINTALHFGMPLKDSPSLFLPHLFIFRNVSGMGGTSILYFKCNLADQTTNSMKSFCVCKPSVKPTQSKCVKRLECEQYYKPTTVSEKHMADNEPVKLKEHIISLPQCIVYC